MKLITAIVNKEDSKNVCNELLKASSTSPVWPPPAAS